MISEPRGAGPPNMLPPKVTLPIGSWLGHVRNSNMSEPFYDIYHFLVIFLLKKETNSQILCRAEELSENTEPVSMTSPKVIKLSRVSRYCANFLLCYNSVSWRYHPPFKEMTPAICCHSTLSLNEHYWRVLDCRLRMNIVLF